MPLFRKPASADPLAVTMAGVKLGDRVLVVGARDTSLIAALATKSGLTGRTCVVDADDTRVKTAGPAIEREGALAETSCAPWGMLPYDDGSFDVAVVRDVLAALEPQTRAFAASEVLRVLRPGGRAVVVEPAPRGGLVGALLQRTEADPAYRASGGAAKALASAGFAATRVLAESRGLQFVEGIKSVPNAGPDRA